MILPTAADFDALVRVAERLNRVRPILIADYRPDWAATDTYRCQRWARKLRETVEEHVALSAAVVDMSPGRERRETNDRIHDLDDTLSALQHELCAPREVAA